MDKQHSGLKSIILKMYCPTLNLLEGNIRIPVFSFFSGLGSVGIQLKTFLLSIAAHAGERD